MNGRADLLNIMMALQARRAPYGTPSPRSARCKVQYQPSRAKALISDHGAVLTSGSAVAAQATVRKGAPQSRPRDCDRENILGGEA
jgi:hypothetical protein